MSIVNASTGHSAPQERRSAKLLYLILIAATLLGVLLFTLMGQKKSINPIDSTTAAPPNGEAPIESSGTSGPQTPP